MHVMWRVAKQASLPSTTPCFNLACSLFALCFLLDSPNGSSWIMGCNCWIFIAICFFYQSDIQDLEQSWQVSFLGTPCRRRWIWEECFAYVGSDLTFSDSAFIQLKHSGVHTGLASMPASGFTTLPLARAGKTGSFGLSSFDWFPYVRGHYYHRIQIFNSPVLPPPSKVTDLAIICFRWKGAAQG